MTDESSDRHGHTVTEKLLADELVAERAKNASFVQRLQQAHGALHTEQVAHDETKARFERFKRDAAAAGYKFPPTVASPAMKKEI